jgi:hypothetical protein
LALELQPSDHAQPSGKAVDTFQINDERLVVGVQRVGPGTSVDA